MNFIFLFIYHSYFIYKGITTYEYILRKEKKENTELSSDKNSFSVDGIDKHLTSIQKNKNDINNIKNKIQKKEEKEEFKSKSDVLEKSDEINFLNQKKEIFSLKKYNLPECSDKKDSFSHKEINRTIEKTPNNINNEEIKINNYFKDRINSFRGSNGNNTKNNFNNIIKIDKEKQEDIDIYDKIKLKYNKNRNKLSSKELIQRLDMLSKKDSESGNKRTNLYTIKGEKIIINSENPSDGIFNKIVDEIYTNKSSTLVNDIKKLK